jgi:hypothetical protein
MMSKAISSAILFLPLFRDIDLLNHLLQVLIVDIPLLTVALNDSLVERLLSDPLPLARHIADP